MPIWSTTGWPLPVDGSLSFRARQGEALGRPGTIDVTVEANGIDADQWYASQGRAVIVFPNRDRSMKLSSGETHVIALQLLPVVLSLLVLAAHFLRAGNGIMVVLVLGLLGLLAVPRAWAARTVQIALQLGAVEWLWTLRPAGERTRPGPASRRCA